MKADTLKNTEKTYILVQFGELFARTDSKDRAIRIARKEAAKNKADVVIEERRITMLIRPTGMVRTEDGETYDADEKVK